MSTHVDDMSAELQRWRGAAGLTLGQLAKQVHYTKGHLSRIENGTRRASPALIRAIDKVVGAEGALVRRFCAPPPAPGRPPVSGAGWWLPGAEPDGEPLLRVLPAGADDELLAVFGDQLAGFRTLGRTLSGATVLPLAVAAARSLVDLARAAGGTRARPFWLLASRFAEFAGWMAQEAGHYRATLTLTDRAVELARTGDDPVMAGYALVRRALVHLYQEDFGTATALAEQAVADRSLPSRIRALAVQRHAQARALAGDRDGFERSAEHAATLLDGAGGRDDLGLGTSLARPVGLAAGWSLLDLGRTAECAETLERELAAAPEAGRRTRARYTIRCALAYARLDEVDRACALARTVLPDVAALSSATIGSDVRRLRTELRRSPRSRAAQALIPDLHAALGPSR